MLKQMTSNVIGWLCGMPAAFREVFVQQPRTCRVIRRAGKGADLQKILLCDVSLPGVCLEGANLFQSCLFKVDLRGANLSNAELSHAQLWSCNLQGAELRGAHLRRACSVGTNLQGADLARADLTGACFWHPERSFPRDQAQEITPEQRQKMGWVSPSLAEADLTEAILIDADLIDADLAGAKLDGVRADVRTRWPEGFDPRGHGVLIPALAAEWRLKRGDILLGTLRDCHPDYRQHLVLFHGHFEPAPDFTQVRSLFEEAARLRGTDQREEYIKARDAIDALRLRLESLNGEVLHPDSYHIQDEDVWFRY
jgi:hypothetical protein